MVAARRGDNREYTITWRTWLGLILIGTCVLAPLAIICFLAEEWNKKLCRHKRAMKLMNSLTRKSPQVPTLIARGPSTRLYSVKVVPSFDHMALFQAVCTVPHCLQDDELALVQGDANADMTEPAWVLMTDTRVCRCEARNLWPKAARFSYDFPYSEMQSVLVFTTPTEALLWVDGCHVAGFPLSRLEEVREMAQWIRAIAGRRLPIALYCPQCDSANVEVLLNSAEERYLYSLGNATMLELINELLTNSETVLKVTVKKSFVRVDEDTDLEVLRGSCVDCGLKWQLQERKATPTQDANVHPVGEPT